MDGNDHGGNPSADEFKKRVVKLSIRGERRMHEWQELCMQAAVGDLPQELLDEHMKQFEKRTASLIHDWIGLWEEVFRSRLPMRVQAHIEKKISQKIVRAPFFVRDGVELCNAGVAGGLGSIAIQCAFTVINTACKDGRKGEYAANEVWCKRSLFPSLHILAFGRV